MLKKMPSIIKDIFLEKWKISQWPWQEIWLDGEGDRVDK